MAAVKISSISTFTIFITLLLLCSRIYCKGNDIDDDCDDDDSGNGGNGGGNNLADILSNAMPDPDFVKSVSDDLNQIISALQNGGNVLKPVSNLFDTIANVVASLGTAATNIAFDMLPPDVSQKLRTPVEKIINFGYDVLFGLDDALKGAANGDLESALKGLKDAAEGLNGLRKGLANFPGQGLLQGIAGAG